MPEEQEDGMPEEEQEDGTVEFKEFCFRLRERKANITLTYRHLEDARMRLGKAVQAYDGGTSCYPR